MLYGIACCPHSSNMQKQPLFLGWHLCLLNHTDLLHREILKKTSDFEKFREKIQSQIILTNHPCSCFFPKVNNPVVTIKGSLEIEFLYALVAFQPMIILYSLKGDRQATLYLNQWSKYGKVQVAARWHQLNPPSAVSSHCSYSVIQNSSQKFPEV